MELQANQITSAGVRSIAVGSFWTAMGYGAQYVLVAAASVVVARLLGAESFGEYGVITSTVALVGTVADMGMGVSAARFVGAYRTADPERAGRTLVMSVQATVAMAVALGIVLATAAPYVAHVWLHEARLVGPLRAATVAIVFTAAGSAVSGGLRGFGLFRQMAVVEMVLGVVTALLMIAGAWTWRFEGALTGFIVGSALRAVAYAIPLIQHVRLPRWRLWPGDAWREARAILRFSVPAFAGGFLVTPVLWVVRVILANSPQGYAQVGTFSAALQWQTPLMFGAMVLGTVLLPSMSEQFEQGQQGQLVKMFRMTFMALTMVQLAASMALVLFSGVLASLYGASYKGLETALSLVAIAAFFNAVLTIPGQVLAAMNRMWVGFLLNLVWASVLVLGTTVAAGRFGAVGASAAYLAAYLVHAATSTGAVIVLLGLPFTTMMPVFLSSGLAVGAVASWRTGWGGIPFLLFGGAATAYLALTVWNEVGSSLAHHVRAAIGSRRSVAGGAR